ncbi:MAG: hypothetical protein HKP58_11075 [Desulfatitalea sp.]|nr:LuxR family transcriptional regulator [Desulfatitalea sp.]NNK00943.1 hypothetical protein [Desulfatitalea sp.]
MDYIKALPRGDLLALLEIVHDASAAKTIEEYQGCFKRVKALVRFDAALSIFADKEAVDNSQPPAYYHYPLDFSDEFLHRYTHEGYFQKSPVFQATYRTWQLQHWRTVWSSGVYGKDLKSMHLAIDYGYCDGWSAAVNNSHGNAISYIAFCGGRIDNDKRTAGILRYLIPHFAESFKYIYQPHLLAHKANEKLQLTARELEILKWTEVGKTTWETSTILNRSERVIKWHLKNAKNKLDAVNRTHAVAIALRHGLLV